MSKHWSHQKERGSLLAIRSIRWFALHFGRSASRLWLYPISFYFFLFAAQSRQASRAYLRRVLTVTPRWWHVLRHIFHFSSTVLDRVYLLTDNIQSLDIQVHHDEQLMHYAQSKQGCILLGAHLGSFEVLRAIGVSRAQIPLKVLMYKEHNNIITTIFDALNPAIAQTVLPLGEANTLLKVNECLQEGDMIAVLGDRAAPNDKVTQCQFLGDTVDFPVGPVVLASILKVPVILVFGLYRGGNHYDIYFELLAEKLEIERRNDEQEVQKWVQCYADRLAHYTRQSPYNWFNFYDFWHAYSTVKNTY